jgi:exodeoxyribonuclease III
MTLRVATYNVNSVRARLPLLLPWLETARPQVIALQETKVQDPDFPVDAFRAIGYHAVFRGEKSYNGVAILSTVKPTRVAFGLAGSPPDEARLAAATVRGVRVVNTYIPQGRSTDDPMFRYKLEWLARLRKYFAETASPSDRILWMGDFNVAPESIDVHDPKRLLGHVCFHPEVSRALDSVRTWGFADVFRRHVSEAGQYSFFDYRVRDAVGRNVGWRVDHIWATAPLAQRSTAAWIDLEPRKSEGSSDHAPVLAEFDL